MPEERPLNGVSLSGLWMFLVVIISLAVALHGCLTGVEIDPNALPPINPWPSKPLELFL